MKTIYSCCLMLLLTLGLGRAVAQSTMVITKTDGTQLTISVAEIQDVTFPSDDRLQVALPYGGFWLHPAQWMRLTATCTTAVGETVASDITWQSTDPSVATVSAEGIVTGVGDGDCQILALAEGGSAAMDLHVTSQTMLDIEVEAVDNLSCTYSITPTDDALRYYYLLRIQSGEYSVDGMTQYGSEEQNVLHFAMEWWEFCADMYGMTWLDFMNEVGLTSGKVTDQGDGLKPGSQYCILAFAMTDDGTLASPIEIKKFQTSVPTQSDISFLVTMNDVTRSSATFTVEPSNDDPYFVNVQRASYVEWFVERDRMTDMAADLTSTITPDVYPEAYCKGTVTRSTDDFLASVRPDTDYYVIVFGYDNGQTSEVTLKKFHTSR